MRFGAFRGIRIALKSLMGHPVRVALAVISVVIGTASVIALTGIGNGAEADVRSRIEGMGANLLVVAAGPSRAVKGQAGVLGIMTTLVPKDATAIKDECPLVKEVAPAHSRKFSVKFESLGYGVRVIGATPAVQSVRNVTMERGAFFDDDDNRLMAQVAVIGPTVVNTLFGGADPIGEHIRIGKPLFKVIGVTAAKGHVSGEDEDDQIFIPLRTAMNKLMNVTYLSHIFMEAAGFEEIRAAQAMIRTILRERHRLREGKEDDFTIQNQADVLEAQSATAKTFSLLTASIAVVSMIIGGVGILGVMLLSVRERVSEIGIRRAVGATKWDIMTQFLVEASALGFVGGVAGLLLGTAALPLITHGAGMPVVASFSAIIAAPAFSFFVGVIFGAYPAWKAARLDPIEALNTKG